MTASTVDIPPELARAVRGRVDWAYAAAAPARATEDTLWWARACFEGARLPMRWFLVTGWVLLLLTGAPRGGPDTVLGWPVARRDDPTVLCRRSRLGLTATLVFVVRDGHVVFASAMTIRTPVARMVWAVAAPIHRWAVRGVLTRAAHGTA